MVRKIKTEVQYRNLKILLKYSNKIFALHYFKSLDLALYK